MNTAEVWSEIAAASRTQLEIPEIEGRLSYLSGKEFTAPLPYLFQKILKEEHVEENK